MNMKTLFLAFSTISILLMSGCASDPLNTNVEQKADQLDADLDGVINERDLCADTLLGATINNDGCPTAITTAKHNDLVVLFAHDSSNIDTIQLAQINRAVKLLKQAPNLAIVLEGHTSAAGGSDYNQQLSKLRAEAVREAFVSRGLSPKRISILPLGESSLLLKSESPQADSLNRRVTAQFKLVNETTDLKWHIYSMDSSS